MVGGSDEALERARPILDVLGKSVTHIGPPGAGQVANLAELVYRVACHREPSSAERRAR